MRIRVPGRFITLAVLATLFLCFLPAVTPNTEARPINWGDPSDPTPEPGAVAEAAWRCLQNAAHFPRLWLAADSPPPENVSGEVGGILVELYDWLHRYRKAIKLIERSANDWPDVAQVFYRRLWRGGVRRIADYLARRVKEGLLPPRDELVAAHLVVEALTWMAVHRHWTDEGAGLSEDAVRATLQPMLIAALGG